MKSIEDLVRAASKSLDELREAREHTWRTERLLRDLIEVEQAASRNWSAAVSELQDVFRAPDETATPDAKKAP